MQKFNAVDFANRSAYLSNPFNGVQTVDFDHVTRSRREQILSGGMGKVKAETVLQALDVTKPWRSARDCIEAMAALCRCFPEDVDKIIPGPNRSGRRILYTGCAPARMEWYFNNIRARHTLSPQQVTLLPAGTTSNEALHAEVRAWFRETQQMHKSTLRIKLRVLHLAKLLTHHAAMYRPTLRQIGSGVVLARTAVSSPWGRQQWFRFASGDGKALLPLNIARQEEARMVALAKTKTAKRPAATKRPAAKISILKRPSKKPHVQKTRRTPFNRPRISSCHIMGKKRQDVE